MHRALYIFFVHNLKQARLKPPLFPGRHQVVSLLLALIEPAKNLPTRSAALGRILSEILHRAPCAHRHHRSLPIAARALKWMGSRKLGAEKPVRQLWFGLLELKKAYFLIIYTWKLFLRVEPEFAKSLNDLSEVEITVGDGDTFLMLLLNCNFFELLEILDFSLNNKE
jgi:hypothetical protein